ncbi:hypothetical protein [Lacipirellula sp.]|uniref:hypothetical protein n=1 Tax=Lacipirellula sp. TaxID=2691419 RepID=UPI003D141E3A
MKIKIGDKVRSTGGVEGEIVSRSNEHRSVMVKVPGIWRNSGIVSIPLARLKFISAYSEDASTPLRRRPK